MALSNYPPGVTGFEPQIAGGTGVEREINACCDYCTFEGDVVAEVAEVDTVAREVYYSFICPVCEEETTVVHGDD